jgi:hypothetical protein
MKSKLLLLSLITLLTVATNYAQTSAETSGIAVQGIARDANNTALTSQTITLTFSIYYNNPGPQSPVYEITENTIQTDEFGVFSYVMDVDTNTNSDFSNHQMYLKITDGDGVIISQEKLKHVPYAIAANNGVPTGSIMPFIGTTAPQGWALCNGQNLGSTTGTMALRTLLGSANAPNLQGMFLRGAGGSGNHIGPAINEKQEDAYKNHNHAATSGLDGGYDYDDRYNVAQANGVGLLYGTNRMLVERNVGKNVPNHNHSISVKQSTTGISSETRPVNYGVNYIIKL